MRYTPEQQSAIRAVAAGAFYPSIVREKDGWHARWLGLGDGNPWIDRAIRKTTMTVMTADAERQRFRTIHDAWLAALRSRTGLVPFSDAECAAFAEALKDWHRDGRDFLVRGGIVFEFDDGLAVRCRVPRTGPELRALGQAVYHWGKLRELKRAPDGERLEVALDRDEAADFLRRGADRLRAAGYTVEAPRLAAEVSGEATVEDDERGVPKVRLEIRVAGEKVTAEEIRFLLDQGSTMVFFRNRWIEVDRAILREALRALERESGRTLSATEAAVFASGLGRVGRLEIRECTAHGSLRELMTRLRGEVGAGFRAPKLKGRLRAYQKRGAAWMKFLTDHGFGALLADDMGLGKTVQTLAWILSRKRGGGAMLVVAPLTLLANWRREAAAFAPTLRVYVHQGEDRALGPAFAAEAAAADVVLTSYTLLVKDYSCFSGVAWAGLVLDEAQAIKNPDTRAAQAVRALTPPLRVALTGTPIENTPEDLWSIEDFLNPGFLGDRAEFRERFVKPLAADPSSSVGRRLKRSLEPFVLRRLKSDPGIAAELGEKREVREYCALSAAQRSAYEAALADFRANERTSGDALALLTELKLICDGAGKFERLAELLEQIFAAGESALVFTQYAKVGSELVAKLGKRFDRVFPFLHGALSAKAREREIAEFNDADGPSAFVLSLKAGGFGLNLTRATHVIHFDRWWNPAVENQATDRAHRIGQEKDVLVHLMITEGTVEEHVDDILRRKGALEGLIRNGEEFLKAVTLEQKT